MKKMLAILVVAVMLLSVALVGCGQEGDTASQAPAESSAATDASTAPAEPAGDDGGVKDVAVLIKATDSDFWQYVLIGATNYAAENPDKVKVTTD